MSLCIIIHSILEVYFKNVEASVIHIHYLSSQGAKPHIYTVGFIGGCIQKEQSLIYTEENDGGCIQEERSHMYTERAKLGFKRSDN